MFLLYRQWLAKATPLMGTSVAINLLQKNIAHLNDQDAAMAISLTMLYTKATQHTIQLAAVSPMPFPLHCSPFAQLIYELT